MTPVKYGAGFWRYKQQNKIQPPLDRPLDGRGLMTGSRRRELAAFLFLTAILIPALSIAVVGGYGLSVWTWQMIAGPPGPSAKG